MSHLDLEQHAGAFTIKAMGITSVFSWRDGPVRVVLLKGQMDWGENRTETRRLGPRHMQSFQ